MTIIKKITSIVLSLAMMLMIIPISHIHADGNMSMDADDNATLVDEEKVYSNATIDDDFADDKVIIVMKHSESMKFKNYTVADFKLNNVKSVKDLSYETGQMVKAKEQKADVILSDGSVYKSDNDVNIETYNQIIAIELEEKGKNKVIDAIKELEKLDNVMYVGPDYYQYKKSDSDHLFRQPTEYQGNYPSIKEHNLIQLDKAWYYETGVCLEQITIGIIDSGIDGDHPDLQGNLCDRPGSQYFHLHKSFVSNNDNPLIDEDGHGTMVAGIIGARGNNAEDYYTTAVGVCWDVNMVSLKVSEYDEGEDDYIAPITRVIQAINYANQVGIDVLNYSMGSYNLGGQLESLTQAIQNYSGLFVCAAGNDALNTDNYPHYPSSIELPNLISVAACTYGDSMYIESNRGRLSVDLFAPGENIYTCSNDGGYTYNSSSSIATPFVSGTAILLKIANPGLTAFEIKDIILQSVDQRSNYICSSEGRLNVYKAMLRALKDTDLIETTDHICNIMYDNISSTQHDIFCDSCNFSYVDAHTLIRTTGTVYCLNCDYIQSHTACSYSYQALDSSWHKAFCGVCGNFYTESHIWYSVEPGVYMCYMCDYVDG